MFSAWKSNLPKSSSVGRKEWVQSASLLGKGSSPKNHALTSLQKLRDDRKKAKQPMMQELEEPKEIPHEMVEEDKLDFNTFKNNYTEFVTVRTLVQAIHEIGLRDKTETNDTPKQPIHVLAETKVFLEEENLDVTEEIDDVDEYENEARAQTGRCIQMKNKNIIYVQDPIIGNPQSRRKWSKDQIVVREKSFSKDLRNLEDPQNTIQVSIPDPLASKGPEADRNNGVEYFVEEIVEEKEISWANSPQKEENNDEILNSVHKNNAEKPILLDEIEARNLSPEDPIRRLEDKPNNSLKEKKNDPNRGEKYSIKAEVAELEASKDPSLGIPYGEEQGEILLPTRNGYKEQIPPKGKAVKKNQAGC